MLHVRVNTWQLQFNDGKTQRDQISKTSGFQQDTRATVMRVAIEAVIAVLIIQNKIPVLTMWVHH